MQENEGELHFFVKIFGQFKKKQYLCTRFRKESNDLKKIHLHLTKKLSVTMIF